MVMELPPHGVGITADWGNGDREVPTSCLTDRPKDCLISGEYEVLMIDPAIQELECYL